MRSLGDPIFEWERFWDTPCAFIEEVAIAQTEHLKQVANRDALPICYAIETMRCIAYSTKEDPYKMEPERFLPYPPAPDKPEVDQGITPNQQTLKAFFAELEKKTIPAWVVGHLSPLLPDWKAKKL